MLPQQVEPLLEQIPQSIEHVTADGAYDETPVYDTVLAHSPEADIVIPPRKNAVYNPEKSPTAS